MSETKKKELSAEEQTLYNRQLYAIGAEAQAKISEANILVIGLNGLGVEVAKNVILAGVGECHLLDETKTTIQDLNSNFFLTQEDVGKSRAEPCAARLAELNKYCKVRQVTEFTSAKGYTVVCLCNGSVAEQQRINALCRKDDVKFVAGGVFGLLATVFVDFGDSHIVNDHDGERPKRGLLSHVSNAEKGVVTMAEDIRHDLEDGDHVSFEEVEGMTQLNESKRSRPIRVINPFKFTIEDTSAYSPYTGNGGYFQQVKQPKKFTFSELTTLLEVGADLPICSEAWGRTRSLHVLNLALGEFQAKHNGALPSPSSASDSAEVLASAKELATKYDIELLDDTVSRLARTAACVISPMCAFLGGIVGQEVLKGAAMKFSPIQQFFYFDAEEALVELKEGETLDLKQFEARGTRYDHQIGIFGIDLHNKLIGNQYFLIGAGAIGCEMLKNWALMGVASDAKSGGKVTVTDMDVIETSNLSRQFLFRPKDVGQLKSITASSAVQAMNSDMNIECHKLCVGPDTESTYDDAFWENIAAVVTALDNVKARLYLDSRCVAFQKPMLDSGTLGTKGNTQVVAPFLTESYGTSKDPPERSIPVCTLKNFPHAIDHTIAWARSKFEGHFTNNANEINNYLAGPQEYFQELAKDVNSELQTLQMLTKLLGNRPSTFEDCIVWARQQFEVEYNNNIQQLLAVYPEDQVDAKGNKFWSGAKRAPTPLTFDANDETHFGFIVAAANLLAFNFRIAQCTERKVFMDVLPKVVCEKFQVDRNVKIAANDEEAKELAKSQTVSADHDTQVAAVQAALPKPDELKSFTAQVVDFEKDDDTNFHMDYITACSNLRARNYKIKEESKHQTKFIAGKIIPAIATTTAMVTGLVCLEMFKTLQEGMTLERYRNAFANLAISHFVFGEPFPPPPIEVKKNDGELWKFTLWDRIDVKGDIKIQDFISQFEEKYNLSFDTLSYNNCTLYSPFMDPKKKKKALGRKLTKAYLKIDDSHVLPDDSKYLILDCVAMNAEGEPVEIPTVRYQYRD